MELGEKAFSLGPVTAEAMKQLSEGKVVQVIGADKPVWKGDSLAEWTSDPSKQEEYGAEIGTMTRAAAGLVCKYGSGVETYGWEGDVAFDSVEALALASFWRWRSLLQNVLLLEVARQLLPMEVMEL